MAGKGPPNNPPTIRALNVALGDYIEQLSSIK
jgi:hypothetical protein